MKPRKPPQSNRLGDLFRVELERIVDFHHPLIKLSATVQWDRLDELFGQTFCADNGRPAVSTRLMVALHYLKYTHNLSDENVLLGWIENPYWRVPRTLVVSPMELC